MYRKPKRSKFHLRDRIFFLFALLFLCATLLRTTPAVSKLQQTVQTFLSGKLSLEETVQAVGSFPSTDAQAYFEEPQIESSLPPETLAATAAGVFPNDIDPFIPNDHASYPSPLADAVCVSSFGLRKHPISGEQKLHKGIDFAAPEGEPIYALSDGIIRTAAESKSYGNYIILEHADGLCSLYAHCKKLLVQTGTPVKAGQTIAQVGETGTATGAHLHLELWRAGKLLDPEDYIIL
ncbi:MAG: M23 family metallopeptidase [Butyricicoccus pullicaecorum]|nr:M23 family metallopeptidase [Butyricicoccus pullicaecorum]